ncbi:MAG: hypothetical protein H0V41_16175 [Pseudonocardiales bacterium]|nr:hypothetical protein [Pseudonocardiales bacterium]
MGEAVAAMRWRPGSVVYAMSHTLVRGLAALRRRRAIPGTVVAVVHPHPTLRDGFDKSVLGLDVAITISARVHDELVAAGRSPNSTMLLPWGPDVGFAHYTSTGDNGLVLSTGKTHRDLATLAAGAEEAGVRVRHLGVVPPGTDTRSIEVVPAWPNLRWLEDLQSCAVVAIPLLSAAGTVGLTELNAALAAGKPVVMTKNPYIDVDVEAIGCGRTVPAGDVDGWCGALRDLLLADGQQRIEMGSRGRAFAEEQWNADAFGEGVAAILAAA